MAVRKVETEVEFKTSDGSSFESEAEAERCGSCGRKHHSAYRCEHGHCQRCHLFSCPRPPVPMGTIRPDSPAGGYFYTFGINLKPRRGSDGNTAS